MKAESTVKVRICQNEEESWDIIWKWLWFTRRTWMADYWKRTEKALKPVFSLLSKFNVKFILDCSCGLGFKTVMFAKMGYKVEGSDASITAVKYASQLAEEHGFKIKFFHSSFEDLGKKSKRKYDCVFSDYFDELGTYEALKKSAKGVFSVLKKDGKFIFCSFSPELTKSELRKLIEQEWNKRKKFEINLPVKQDGLKVTHIEVANKTKEGILENHIFLIEEKDRIRAEIASIMNPRIKWTYQDYVNALKEAGFAKIEHVKREEKEVLIIATK